MLQCNTSYVTKVIKNTKYGSTYQWNSSYSGCGWCNDYNYNAAMSFNNTSIGANYIYNTMNTTVYNSLDSTLKSQIASGRYYFKVYSTTMHMAQVSASDSYKYERNGTSLWGDGYADCNVALLNFSDFKYATLSSVCSRTSTGTYNDTCGQNNWIGKMMYSSLGNGNVTWVINVNGYKNSNNWYTYAPALYATPTYNSVYGEWGYALNNMFAIFPVFYLKNQSYISSGSGTSANPYRIA